MLPDPALTVYLKTLMTKLCTRKPFFTKFYKKETSLLSGVSTVKGKSRVADTVMSFHKFICMRIPLFILMDPEPKIFLKTNLRINHIF